MTDTGVSDQAYHDAVRRTLKAGGGINQERYGDATGLVAVRDAYEEEVIPVSFRVARYPDGAMRTQGGFQWQKGYRHGVVWRDVKVVAVDADGLEIPNADY